MTKDNMQHAVMLSGGSVCPVAQSAPPVVLPSTSTPRHAEAPVASRTAVPAHSTAQHSMHACGGLGECHGATVQSGHGYDWNDRLLSEGWQLNGTRLCLRALC